MFYAVFPFLSFFKMGAIMLSLIFCHVKTIDVDIKGPNCQIMKSAIARIIPVSQKLKL